MLWNGKIKLYNTKASNIFDTFTYTNFFKFAWKICMINQQENKGRSRKILHQSVKLKRQMCTRFYPSPHISKRERFQQLATSVGYLWLKSQGHALHHGYKIRTYRCVNYNIYNRRRKCVKKLVIVELSMTYKIMQSKDIGVN